MAPALLLIALGAPGARALDPFEIQVYDGTANRRGEAGLELHLNYSDPQAHLTLEPSYGLTGFLELGAYLQFAHGPDGGVSYAGAKLRCKLVTPPSFDPHLRLGVNFELSWLPEEFDRSRYGGEVRPIAAWENEWVLLAINPIIGFAFARPDAPAGPSIEPAGMAKLKLGPVAIGAEYYSALGTFTGILPAAAQQHYLFETIDLLGFGRLELNAGFGQGLTRASKALIGKMIVGYTFG